MIDFERLRSDLKGFAPDQWVTELIKNSQANILDSVHGNLPGWRETLGLLPDIGKYPFDLRSPVIESAIDWEAGSQRLTRESYLALKPWRKGPYNVGGIHIDSEWRSDLKWERVKNNLSDLNDRDVLDIGCGNGYHCWRQIGAGARSVLGIDPMLHYVMQFNIFHYYLNRNCEYRS